MAISDIEAAATAPGRIPAGSCCVCTALAELPKDQSASLVRLLKNPQVRYTELSEHLAADEDTPLDLGAESLRKHARGRCAARVILRASSRRA